MTLSSVPALSMCASDRSLVLLSKTESGLFLFGDNVFGETAFGDSFFDCGLETALEIFLLGMVWPTEAPLSNRCFVVDLVPAVVD